MKLNTISTRGEKRSRGTFGQPSLLASSSAIEIPSQIPYKKFRRTRTDDDVDNGGGGGGGGGGGDDSEVKTRDETDSDEEKREDQDDDEEYEKGEEEPDKKKKKKKKKKDRLSSLSLSKKNRVVTTTKKKIEEIEVDVGLSARARLHYAPKLSVESKNSIKRVNLLRDRLRVVSGRHGLVATEPLVAPETAHEWICVALDKQQVDCSDRWECRQSSGRSGSSFW